MNDFITMNDIKHTNGKGLNKKEIIMLKEFQFHDVEKTPCTHDKNSVILFTDTLNNTYVIRCKHTIRGKNVGYKALQEANSSGDHYMTNHNILVTNGGFTQSIKHEMITKDWINTKCWGHDELRLSTILYNCFKVMDNKNLAVNMLNQFSVKAIKQCRHTIHTISKIAKYYHLKDRDLVVSKILNTYYNKKLLAIKNSYRNKEANLNSLKHNHNIYSNDLKLQKCLFNSISKTLRN